MMNNKLRESYMVKDSVQKAYLNQIGLKMNKEYEFWADNVGIKIIEYFFSKYPEVKIEMPKIREKSLKSLLGKIKNLQIERLSKLYAIEGISNNDKESFYLLIEERINENNILDTKRVLETVNDLIYNDINEFDINQFEERIMVEGITRSTKTALLRILVSKIENSNLKNKEEQIKILDEKYGKKAAMILGSSEYDIIKYDSINKIKENPDIINRLRDENRFLKANDLRGMKIVVVDIPDDFKTNNERIKRILEERKKSVSSIERVLYTHLAIVEIGKEFYADLANDKQFLQSLNLEVIPDSNKHKKKSNGYEAEHIKFHSYTNPAYTLELQFKSEYVETICKGEGMASHQNRPGKQRILPQTNNDRELIEKLIYMVPKYKVFKKHGNTIKVKKFSMLKNVMGYFEGQISPGDEEYEKIIQVLSPKNEIEKAI